MYSFILITAFLRAYIQDLEASTIRRNLINAMMATSVKRCPWGMIKLTVDNVHCHECGCSAYSDKKLSFIWNEFWNRTKERYFSEIVKKCFGSRHTSFPVGTQKVSPSSMNWSFDEVLCSDYFHQSEICLLFVMYLVTCFSACKTFSGTGLFNLVSTFGSCWLSRLVTLSAVYRDPAFLRGIFLNYLSSIETKFMPIPPRRYSEINLESKRVVIWSTTMRVMSDSTTNFQHSAVQAAWISKVLYGSNAYSAFEIDRELTELIFELCTTFKINPDLHEVRISL